MALTRKAAPKLVEPAPEASLLTVSVKRSALSQQSYANAPQGPALITAWQESYDELNSRCDEATLRDALGENWNHCFFVETASYGGRYVVRPIGQLPEDIMNRLGGGNGLARLVDQINHIATANSHAFQPVTDDVLLDEDDEDSEIELILVPLTVTDGMTVRFLGTLEQ